MTNTQTNGLTINSYIERLRAPENREQAAKDAREFQKTRDSGYHDKSAVGDVIELCLNLTPIYQKSETGNTNRDADASNSVTSASGVSTSGISDEELEALFRKWNEVIADESVLEGLSWIESRKLKETTLNGVGRTFLEVVKNPRMRNSVESIYVGRRPESSGLRGESVFYMVFLQKSGDKGHSYFSILDLHDGDNQAPAIGFEDYWCRWNRDEGTVEVVEQWIYWDQALNPDDSNDVKAEAVQDAVSELLNCPQ